MSGKTKTAVPFSQKTAADNLTNQKPQYNNFLGRSRPKCADRIAKHKTQIPKLYRGIYNKAITGKSRKAAMHAFCLEVASGRLKRSFCVHRRNVLCIPIVRSPELYRERLRASQTTRYRKSLGKGISYGL